MLDLTEVKIYDLLNNFCSNEQKLLHRIDILFSYFRYNYFYKKLFNMKNRFSSSIILVLVIFLFSTCSPEVIPNYNLKVSVTPVEGGTVTPSEGSYTNGTTVSLLATPSPEYIFKEWIGGVTGTTNPISVTMNSNKNITVVFEKRMYPLSIIIEGEGTVTEELISSKTTKDYPSGSVVKLTALPIDGWEFVEWSGDSVGTENPITITVDKSKSITVKFIPIVYRDYLKTSYELSNFDEWFSSDDLFNNGTPYTDQNPFLVMQTTQVDINGDGLEDLFTYDSYSLNTTITNPPPRVFMNDGTRLNQISWNGPNMRMPHGVKLLVGDFNNDSFPDIFSLVAIDPPFGLFPDLTDYNNIIFNSPTGFNSIKEFDDQLGFWYTGCSGDIDNDGDLDVIMFNFHYDANGVASKILWNDGVGNFSYDDRGIGEIPVVDASELIDVNGDGYLDLVIDYITNNPRTPNTAVMWGNGEGFDLINSSSFTLEENQFIHDLDFADLDSDGMQELIISGNSNGTYWIEIYQSIDNGNSFINRSLDYIEDNISYIRFDHLIVSDIDNNGKVDIFAPDRKDNIRWEWNGSQFVRVY